VGDDGVVLTERERQALAGLAESIGDPWLARQLVGQDAQSPRPKRRIADSAPRFSAATSAWWIGLVLVLAGAVLAVTTFASSPLVASLGLVAMGAGLWRLVTERGHVLIRGLTSRLTERRVSEHAPSPPRTPPAAQ